MAGELRWSIDGKWPTSFDGSPAFRCDRHGDPSTKGKYLKWYEKTVDGDAVHKIAKIIRPEKVIEPLDVESMRTELRTNKKYDIKNARTANRLRQRLQRIGAKMGIQYIDALQATRITPEVDVSTWAVNDKQEYILINPYILSQRVAWAEGILKQQILHRALWRGRENLTDKELMNIVLDICSNRVLASTTSGRLSKSWTQMCRWLYPEESKATVLALCNASLSEADVARLRMKNPKFAEIWEELYKIADLKVETVSAKTGRKSTKTLRRKLAMKIQDINPDDLYFRLKDYITEEDRSAMQRMGGGVGSDEQNQQEDSSSGDAGDRDSEKGMNPFGQRKEEMRTPDGQDVKSRDEAHREATQLSQKTEDGLRRSLVPKRHRHGISWKAWSDCRTDFWDKYVKSPDDIYDPDLAAYARKIHTNKVMENVAGRIIDNLENDTEIQVFPHRLTEEGLIMHHMGFNRKNGWPFFLNHHGEEGKKRVVVFFDLSPSMYLFFTHMMYMCDSFEKAMDLIFARNQDGADGVLTFAGSVRSLSREEIDEMRHGTIQAGASTSFNAMVEYCCNEISDNDIDAVIVFTDGESAVSPENIKLFNGMGKRMFRIYMQQDTKANFGQRIQSDLDFLNGESYTLNVPKTDVQAKAKMRVS